MNGDQPVGKENMCSHIKSPPRNPNGDSETNSKEECIMLSAKEAKKISEIHKEKLKSDLIKSICVGITESLRNGVTSYLVDINTMKDDVFLGSISEYFLNLGYAVEISKTPKNAVFKICWGGE